MRSYMFGQILFMKYESEDEQINNINKLYSSKNRDKGKLKKAIPIPIIELLDISNAHVESLDD